LKLLKQFDRFDKKRQGELEEDEALQLFEDREQTRTAAEHRQLVKEIDLDKNRKLCFLELCCSIFHKQWSVLHAPSHDPAQLALLNQLTNNLAQFQLEAQKHSDEVALAEAEKRKELSELELKKAEIGEVKAQKEAEEARKRLEQQKKHDAEEAEKHRLLAQKGTKGAAAKFDIAASSTRDETSSNAEKIKAEAAHRRELKRLEDEQKKADLEAKRAAEEAEKLGSAKVAAEQDAARLAAETAEAERKRLLAEKALADKEAYEAAKAIEEAARIAAEAAEAEKKAQSRDRLKNKAAAFEGK